MTRIALMATLCVAAAFAQPLPRAIGPQPVAVDPGPAGGAPSDAVVLFNGKDLTGWTMADGSPAKWKVADGAMVCVTGSGSIFSAQKYRDAQLHLEFNVPSMPDQSGQRKGNSGVYLQGKYELQVLDSWNNPTYADGHAGAVYGTHPPLVLANRKAGEWQSYDIVFHAPKCAADGKTFETPGRVTVFLNGVLVQDHATVVKGRGGCTEEGPLMLQDHAGFKNPPATELKFRNIWLRHLRTPSE